MSMIDDPGPKLSSAGSSVDPGALAATALPTASPIVGTLYQWRRVRLGYLGIANGYDRGGNISRVVIPTVIGGKQHTIAQIQVEAEDANWTNGILSIRKGSDPNGVFADLGTPQTIIASETQETVTGINYPYLALQVTTVESGGSNAYLTVTISTSEGG